VFESIGKAIALAYGWH